MAQNNRLLNDFGNGIESLKDATLNSAAGIEKHTQETIEARAWKGLSNNCHPNFSNKDSENFADWYDDVLSILALKEW